MTPVEARYEPTTAVVAVTEEEHMLLRLFRRGQTRHTEVQRTLRRIEDRLDLIFHMEKNLMSGTDDVVAKLQAATDESDTILAGVQSIEAAQATGSQPAIDAAVAAAVATISAAADNTKAHLDAVLAAVTAGLPPAPPAAPAPAPAA